jgi:hypothetical protein
VPASQADFNQVVNGMRPQTKGGGTAYYMYYNGAAAKRAKLTQDDIIKLITKENAALGDKLKSFLKDNEIQLGEESFERLQLPSGAFQQGKPEE